MNNTINNIIRDMGFDIRALNQDEKMILLFRIHSVLPLELSERLEIQYDYNLSAFVDLICFYTHTYILSKRDLQLLNKVWNAYKNTIISVELRQTIIEIINRLK